MGTGWRRAFCTTIPRDTREAITTPLEEQSQSQNQNQRLSPSPSLNSSRSYAKLGFQSGGSSNPSTPGLRCKTSNNTNDNVVVYTQTPSTNDDLITPKLLHCKTTPKSYTKIKSFGSNPSSPRSPFSILKKTLRLSRNSCGVCMQSVKTSQGMAIYTAECSHTFHFPCIATRIRNQNSLICPVCNNTWKDVPLLAIHKLEQETQFDEKKSKKVQAEQSPKITQQETKAYDDDEPLVSPTASTKFIPIPEAREQEVEEFQGFFVNPLSSDIAYLHDKDGRNVEVSLLPEAAVISVGRTHETYAVVLKVKAPTLPPPPPTHVLDPARRAPIDLVTVLDVSESMSGAKLQMLKRAVGLLISSLGSADRLCIIAFAATPKRLMPLRRMTPQGQGLARSIIDRLVCSQGSSICEALKKATKVLDDRRHKNTVASIILLSDGQDDSVQANHNNNDKNTNQRRESPQVSSTRFAHVEIPVRSSGFCPEPAVDAFSKCVSGLLSVVVQDLKIQIGFSHGSDSAEISAIYSCHARPTVMNSSCILVGDLYAEEEREYLVEMKVPIPSSAVVGSHSHHHVFSVRCSYKDPATQELIYGGEHPLLVPRPRNSTVGLGYPKIEQRFKNRFITVRAIGESRRLFEHNEVSSAMQLLSSARALLIQSTPDSAGEYVRELDVELAELQWKQMMMIQRRRMTEREIGLFLDESEEPVTPLSARKSAKVAQIKNRVSSDLHGFENARF
ncbi:Zinc finger (C3HC4-type RING finger) family protein [Forsythia ovata]|uniref:Zinc finger (C3HC4-type RING finger) family protein n=1 Tax=Forsythia ovata TaxID=205694 RepID=A0ABD1P8L6_9LAMI